MLGMGRGGWMGGRRRRRGSDVREVEGDGICNPLQGI